MKTLGQLASKTPPRINEKWSGVDIKYYNSGPRKILRKYPGFAFEFKSSDPVQGSGRYHRQTIWYDSSKVKKSNYLNTPVRVFCSCEYFNYYLAYALGKHKSVIPRKEISYAVKTPARVTNPGSVPFICKHLYAIAMMGRKRKFNIKASLMITDKVIKMKYVKVKSNLIYKLLGEEEIENEKDLEIEEEKDEKDLEIEDKEEEKVVIKI